MNRKPVRIAYLIDDLGYGGAQRQLSLLAEALPAPYQPVLISLSENIIPFGRSLAAQGLEVRALKRRRHYDLLRLAALVRCLAGGRINLIHGFLDASSANAYLAGRLLRIPTILTLRSDRQSMSGIRARWLHRMYRQAARVMVNSRAGEQYLLGEIGLPRSQVVTIPNWFPPATSSMGDGKAEPPTANSSTATIGYVGRFSEEKRVDLLIRAFAVVAARKPEARLVLFGDGNTRPALEKLAGVLQLQDKIQMPGPASKALAEMANMTCLVLPSVYEGLPNVIIEALSVGTPVVAGAVGDVPALVKNGSTGVLVKDMSPDGLAAGIITALTDDGLRREARSAGPRLVEKDYSMSTGLEKIAAMYESILAGE
jgi:glycosyltransferase involved in cell wall biosynthesis